MPEFAPLMHSPGGACLRYLADIPVVYHCHHFNLWWDQTVDDILGESLGAQVRTRAARDAFHHLLRAVGERLGVTTPAARLALAEALFAWMGQGRLDLSELEGAGAEATARGSHLHYATSWRWKYTPQARRFFPADAVAAGCAAAARAWIRDQPAGEVRAQEIRCLARDGEPCEFDLGPDPVPVAEIPATTLAVQESHAGPCREGLLEGRIQALSEGLEAVLATVEADAQGLIQAFNVFVSLHLPAYYNRTGFEAVHLTEARAPFKAAAAEDLLREAGRVCAFNTFGSILLDAVFEGLLGAPLDNDPANIVAYSCAIARALGFGHWEIAEFVPGRLLRLRVPTDYESAFYLQHYGPSDKPRNYFLQGGAQAMVLLAHEIDWASRPELTNSMYLRMFKQPGLRWKVEQTRCRTLGDEASELQVVRL